VVGRLFSEGAELMRKTDLVFWTFLTMTGLAGATTVLNVTQTYSANSPNSELYRQLDLFGDVFERVRSDYVEKPDDTMLVESAINGMLAALDPHSSYMSPKNYRDMQVQTRGEFGGLGIEVTMENGVVKVVSPIDDTPASKAGIQANDLITHLDNDQISGLTLEQAVEKMRGPVNTPITLTVVRKGKEEPFDVKIVRDFIRINAIKARKEGDDIAYVKVTTFNEQTHTNLVKAMDNLKKEIGAEKLRGIVIDLRNNPGGLLDQAIAVSDDFLDRGAIVLTKGRNNEETQRAQARPGDSAEGKPIVVLINGGSASASEIVAGALKDHKRATIVGTRSFGKGSVQTIIPLGANGAIRLTTARYYTPSNRSIQAKGIDPDIIIEQELPEDMKKQAAAEKPRGEASLRGHLRGENPDEEGKEPAKEESGSSAYVPKEPEKDTQLQYALSFLRGTATGETVAKKPAAPAPADTPNASNEPKSVPN
jgi:carboxyl-terminal processing protease